MNSYGNMLRLWPPTGNDLVTFNQNVQNRLNAANSLYGAGNTTGGLLSQFNQQGLANQQAGAGAAQTAGAFANDPFNQQLAIEQSRASSTANRNGLAT